MTESERAQQMWQICTLIAKIACFLGQHFRGDRVARHLSASNADINAIKSANAYTLPRLWRDYPILSKRRSGRRETPRCWRPTP